MEVLEARLRGRGTETEERIRARLGAAQQEAELARGLKWDTWVVNGDLDVATRELDDLLALPRSECEAWRAEHTAHTPSSGPKEGGDDAAKKEGGDAAKKGGDDAAKNGGDDAAKKEGDDAAKKEGDDGAKKDVEDAEANLGGQSS